MTGNLLDDVRQHYEKCGISANNFHCNHLKKCKGALERFTEGREASIGTEYERHTLPRILFLSLDPPDIGYRTLEELRSWQEYECDFVEVRRRWPNQHWYQTHEMAWKILSRFRPSISVEETKFYFAHTNSAKCCVHNIGNKQAPARLFNNCRECIAGEIQALEPDIIVSQGNKAGEAIDKALKNKSPKLLLIEESGGDCYFQKLSMNGRQVLRLHSYHPRYVEGFFSQKKQCWGHWADIAFKMFCNSFPTIGA